MSKIAVSTSQNIELEYDLGSLGDRIVAGLIDYGILLAYIIVISMSISFTKMHGTTLQIILFIAFFPIAFYSLLSELLLHGQSVGKRIMKLKVINISGEQASLGQYLIRWLFRFIDVWFFSGVVAIIVIATSNKRQRLGDLVAGTAVVKTKIRTTFNQTIYTPVFDDNYKVIYPEVIHLKDNDIQLIKEIILNVNINGNTMLALEAMRKIEKMLAIQSQHEPRPFLETILSDYNYLAAKV